MLQSASSESGRVERRRPHAELVSRRLQLQKPKIAMNTLLAPVMAARIYQRGKPILPVRGRRKTPCTLEPLRSSRPGFLFA
jgi:hypothetical protein